MSIISAGTLVTDALVHTADNTGRLVFKTNGSTTALTLDSAQAATFAGGVTVTGNLTVAGTTTSFGDNDKIVLGDGQDLQIFHDGSNSVILDNGTGNLNIKADEFNVMNAAGNETKIAAASNGAATLYYDNTARIATTATGGAVTGQVTATAGGDITGEFIADSYNETYAAVTSSSNATTVNCHNGNAFSHTLTENTTFTFSNPPSSGVAFSFSIEIIQDGSASGYSVTWPGTVDWPAATAPTLTATASAKDVFVFYTRDGGTNWYGFTAGQALG